MRGIASIVGTAVVTLGAVLAALAGKAPTLLLLGDRDVPNIRAIVNLLAESVPGSRKVTIPGAGHMVNMEKPAEFDRAVLPFLRERGSR